MGFLGNFLWFLLGGWLLSLGWALAGLLWCLTIVGIPVGMQCFKFAALAISPFGRDVEYTGGPVSVVMNIFWLIFGGIELATTSAIAGCIFCITIIGIPFGLQHFKFAQLALFPFGSSFRTH
jgi:uncharacterized membrane protein YccF (DUF307 family)